MSLAVLSLNAFRGWLGDQNAAFQQQQGIAYQDQGNRQECLNAFIEFVCDRARAAGAIEVPVEREL